MAILDRPPADWTRPSGLRQSTKRAVLLRQGGRCADTGADLVPGDVEFDHRPAVWSRQFDTVANDTVPSFHDPDFIDALTTAAHDRRTNGAGGEKRVTTAGSDAHLRAKENRLRTNEARHSRRMAEKIGIEAGDPPSKRPAPAMKSRPFPKGRHSKIPSRPFPSKQRGFDHAFR